ncbi:MAG: hypothetical protein AMXMBFR84_10830 [Candidatus Hydrogenedentota bacterium]
MSILSELEATEKRDQLLHDGYCVIPGVLRGDLLNRLRAFSDELLDNLPADPATQYQGSDFHVNSLRRQARGDLHRPDTALTSSLVDELVDLPEAWEACRLLGLEGQQPDDTMLILSKPANGPALYWHQDFMEWNHPKACLPWPTRIFLSYYLVDTTKENGCLRAIPGTHLKRIPLHDVLPPAHGPEIQAATPDHPAFQDHPDAVDLPVKAGDLVINDARLLHAAYANQSNQRRTLILQWHGVFPWPTVPSWWNKPKPKIIEGANADIVTEVSRIPGEFLGVRE